MTTASDWSGTVGDIWAAEWRRTDRSFADLASHLNTAVFAAAPERGRAVDLGCGAGATSVALASARPDLTVTGIDLSPELVRVASSRGSALPNLSFATADIAADPARIAAGVDLLFSRHGVMFFADPAAVFARLRAAANPGARIVFSCFRRASLNPWATALVSAVTGSSPAPADGYAPGPFGFADDE